MTKGKYGILDTSYLSKRHKQYILKENKKKDDLIEITWTNLKTLRDTNSLQQGKWYKITDYVATTTQESTKSANHPFDIIVRADSPNVLNENAFAEVHEGDNYFSEHNCKLEAWRLKYCLDNDRTKFAWAKNYLSPETNRKMIRVEGDSGNYIYVRYSELDSDQGKAWVYENGDYESFTVYIDAGSENLDTNDIIYTQTEYPQVGDVLDMSGIPVTLIETSWGKGVIYWMQDEWLNEAYYDFKGIQFLRSAHWLSQHESWAEGIFDGEVPDEDKYFYFLSVLINKEIKDASLVGNTLINDEGNISGVYMNKDSFVSESIIDTEESGIYALSKNCFVGFADEDGYYNGCYSNIFRNNCYFNTFGNNCSGNNFGDGCYNNVFENYCGYNTFRNGCSNNTFGNDCSNNTFGNSCSRNTFMSGCNHNAFGDDCISNTFNKNNVYYVTVYPMTRSNQLNVVANALYPQFVGKDSSGTVCVFTLDDILAAKNVVLRLNANYPYSTKIEISKDLYDKARIASLLIVNNIFTMPSVGICRSARDNNDESLEDVFISYIHGQFSGSSGIYSFGYCYTTNGVFDFSNGGEVYAFFEENNKYYFYSAQN